MLRGNNNNSQLMVIRSVEVEEEDGKRTDGSRFKQGSIHRIREQSHHSEEEIRIGSKNRVIHRRSGLKQECWKVVSEVRLADLLVKGEGQFPPPVLETI